MNGGVSGWAFPLLLTLLCLVTAVTYVVVPDDIVPTAAKVLLLTAFVCGAGWFAHAFTGDPAERRHEQVQFAYFFVIASFAVLTIPPFLKSEAVGGEPVGIVSGCVMDAGAAPLLRCDGERGTTEQGTTAAATDTAARRPAHDQWLVNLGGALRTQADRSCTPAGSAQCKPGSSGNRVAVTGGVVVPLPLVIIALFGGAISLSRRVPEIQKRSEPGFVGAEAEPKIDARQAREQLVFQIMQFLSAPLIAITAHQVIEPTGQASAVALAFLAGFGSETILLMIRGVANGLHPRTQHTAAPQATAGAADENGGTGGVAQAVGAVAGGALGNQAAPLMLGDAGEHDPAAEPVHIRLCVDGDDLEAGSLAVSVDGRPAGVPTDGCVELALAPGRAHRVEAHGRRAGQPVHGELALTARAEDDGRPVQLALG